ncbi:MAG: immune inhibitor A [Chloroflexi bacterium]|nr:immune inhibitor A [Chloroflexota bacterium]MCL5275790.1 immune inhibitor A [Chloroflexota bacterium]
MTTTLALDPVLTETLPPENLSDLAIRFKGVSPQQAVVTCTQQSKGYDVGATRQFILSNQDANSEFTITAVLKYKTQYAYMWVETAPDKLSINSTNLRRAADQFTNKILPTDRAFFGDEGIGVDCDPHLYILHASGVGSTVGGYFSSPDSYTRAVRPDSNEAKMFVVNAEPGYNGSDPGSASYMSTLAHEYQHMISFHQVHASALWLEEGAAQLAERLNGYADEVGTVYSFASAPDTQLNTWSEGSAGENSAHYGGGYLFWSYLYDRFGPDVTRKLAHTHERSIPAFMATLASAGITSPDTGNPYVFQDLFADWVIANYMGTQKMNKSDQSNRYNYTETSVPPMSTYANLTSADYPYDTTDQVNQYGTHYIELKGDSPVTLQFTGSTSVPLLPMDDTTNQFWWSNRADASDTRMTREVDLTKVGSATLKFRAWYRIETDYDYGYVSASTDNGATWKILDTTTCTSTNPNGSNLGCGYTGSSGDGGSPQWVDESADLSPYAGKKILLRFEVVTDAGVNREGLAIDDIQIPEIGFKDGASSDTGWKSEGFVRTDNILPQFWSIQMIVTKKDGTTTLVRIPLTDNAGTAKLDFGAAGAGAINKAILAISATTLVVTEPGSFELSVK